ncbi:MAG: MMPL family transporter [Cryomorphaceae bacterium]
MWAELARLIIRYKLAIIIALAVFTAGMLYQATGVKLAYGLPQMLPEDSPTMIDWHAFQDRFKEESTVFAIGIEEDLFHDVELFNAWYHLGRKVANIEGVDTLLSIGSAFDIVKDTSRKVFAVDPLVKGPVSSIEELDSLRRKYESLPFYKGLLYNSENNHSIMAISMDNERFNSTERTEFFGSVLEVVESFEVESGIKIYYSGMPYIRENLSALVKKELKTLLMLTILITITILLIFFRSIKPVLISMTVVCMGVIWSLGTLNILGYEITILTSLISPLVIVIGIPNCIYLINKFHSELNEHGNKAKALVRVVSRIGSATFMTNATTATGFLTFVFTESILLVEFGIVAFISIMFLFLLSILIITITYSYLPPPTGKKTDHLNQGWVVGLVNWFGKTINEHRPAVYVITAVVVLLSINGMRQIQTTGNIVDDLPKNHKVVNDLHWFEKNFGGVVPFEIEIDTRKKRRVSQTKVLEDIDATQELFRGDPNFSKSISIVDAMKFIKQAFYNGDPERYELISSRERAFFSDYVDNSNADKSLLNTYVDSTQRYARINLQVADIGTIEMDSLLAAYHPRIDSIFNPKRRYQDSLLAVIRNSGDAHMVDSLAFRLLKRNASAKRVFKASLPQSDSASSADLESVKFSGDTALIASLHRAVDSTYTGILITGPSITFLEGTNYLVRNLFISLSIAILIVALLMAVVFSSLRMIIISVITNLIPLLFTAGIMGYFGINIKPSTILVFSVAFGISVDDTIHYLAKYRQELRLTRNDIGRSVRLALKETGVSMVYTSIILFFGFGVFASSDFGGTQALGILVSLTLMVAMFANLILLPSFLMSFEKAMLTRWFQEPFMTLLDEEEDLELDDLDFKEENEIEFEEP